MSDDDQNSNGVQEEFLAEAQEIVEGLSRNLLMLDQAQKEGNEDLDLVNEVFRGVHTLKGIAAMFGYAQVGTVAHALEDLLDDLRLGRIELNSEVLDVLFDGVENFQRLLGGSPTSLREVDLSGYARSIERLAPAEKTPPVSLDDYDLGSGVLSVLTEYEEHRLQTNVRNRVPLFRLQVSFSLSTIDSALETLKEAAKPIAEIITYLPSMVEDDQDAISLDVIMASDAQLAELRDALLTGEVSATGVLKAIERREHHSARPLDSDPQQQGTHPPPSAGVWPNTMPPPVAPEPAPLAAPPPADPAPVPALSLRSVSQSVRVDIRKLDNLMNVVGELAIVRNSVGRITDRIRARPELRQMALDLYRVNRSFERHLGELQEGILDVRMVPLGQVFDKLARLVRQVARDHEKEISLSVTGAETEVDKLIVEELSDPLMHIIRNAIDHGVQKPKARELAGKSPSGTLALNAYPKGNHVVIEIEDDGAGMDPTNLAATAVKRGILTAEEAADLSHDEAIQLIFTPGFTTRSAITDLSGRGVGMDVVKTNIARLGGVIAVTSEPGTGTRFVITLPITLAIVRALLVGVQDRVFAVPLTSVVEALQLIPANIRAIEGREVITMRGSTLNLCRIARLFEIERDSAQHKQFVVVCSLGERRVGFVVDELLGQQDVVIKALGKSIKDVRGFSGATDLGDQRVALVLDPPALIEEVLQTADRPRLLGARS